MKTGSGNYSGFEVNSYKFNIRLLLMAGVCHYHVQFQDAFDAEENNQSVLFGRCDFELSSTNPLSSTTDMDDPSSSLTLTSASSRTMTESLASRLPFSSTSTERHSSGSTYMQDVGSSPLTPDSNLVDTDTNLSSAEIIDERNPSIGTRAQPTFPSVSNPHSTTASSESFQVVSNSAVDQSIYLVSERFHFVA